MCIKRLRYKSRKKEGQLPLMLDMSNDNNEILLDFCKKQSSYGKYIMSMKQTGSASTQVIIGNIEMYPDADFSMILYLVESSPVPIKLCTIEATYGEVGIDQNGLIVIKKGIHIENIVVWRINDGYGSLLLEFMIDFCRQNHLDSISGSLAPIDTTDHPERLYHFYQKHGFTITDTDDPDTKSIYLKLNE